MMIINLREGKMINLTYATSLTVHDSRVQAHFSNGQGTSVCEFSSRQIAFKFIEYITNEMITGKKAVTIPSDEYLQSLIINSGKDIHRNRNGAKTKGHGGS